MKGAVEGTHRGKARLEGAIGNIVLALAEKKYSRLQPCDGQVFAEIYAEAGLEIPRYIALVVAEVLCYGGRGDGASIVLVYVKEHTRAEVGIHSVVGINEIYPS